MPKNFDALLRYHVIDACLQNNFYGCTLDFLAEKCTEALIEKGVNPDKNMISKRTIQDDIGKMRSDKLGYNAPIDVKSGKYFYTDRSFGISNATITNDDIKNISAAVKMLKPYKGAVFFREIEALIGKLEQKVHLNTYKRVQTIIAFEHIPESSGTDYINPLMNSIINRQVIVVTYQRFGLNKSKKHICHPYLLKEYRNRWYLLGMNDSNKGIQTLALDRIIKFEILPDREYDDLNKPDADFYFKNTIGITVSGDDPVEIILSFNQSKLPYIKTQPLHESQKVIEETANHIIVSLYLTLNYELESLIMSFADEVKVIEPLSLKEAIEKKLKKATAGFGSRISDRTGKMGILQD